MPTKHYNQNNLNNFADDSLAKMNSRNPVKFHKLMQHAGLICPSNNKYYQETQIWTAPELQQSYHKTTKGKTLDNKTNVHEHEQLSVTVHVNLTTNCTAGYSILKSLKYFQSLNVSTLSNTEVRPGWKTSDWRAKKVEGAAAYGILEPLKELMRPEILDLNTLDCGLQGGTAVHSIRAEWSHIILIFHPGAHGSVMKFLYLHITLCPADVNNINLFVQISCIHAHEHNTVSVNMPP